MVRFFLVIGVLVCRCAVGTDQGLIDKFAKTTAKRAGYDWWSLQRLGDVKVPEGAAQHSVDRFIAAKLAEKGLHLAPAADARTLIRRATYDLTGLPPTPEEVQAFEEACAKETGAAGKVGDAAYGALLDRLLASPHYGEQWGRHWLDVARYGESTGYEVNQILGTVWPYRDYVIKSFNDDKPFSQFMLEQLAGDAIAPGNPDVETGLTFLVCGPYDIVGNQDPVQAAQIRADGIDEMIRTTSEAFMGLTVGCARCHDHKFDPIAQRDYYSMYATLAGVFNDDRTVATPAQMAAHEAQLAPLEARHAAALTQIHDLEKGILDRAEAKAAQYESRWMRPPVKRSGTEETFTPVQAKFVRLKVEARDDDPNAATGFRIDEFEAWNTDAAPKNVALAANGGKAAGESRVPDDFAQAYKADLTIDGKYGARWIAGGPELTIEFAKEERINRVVFSSDRPAALAKDSGEILFPAEYGIEVSRDGKEWTEVANARDRQPANEKHRRKRLLDLEATTEEHVVLEKLSAEAAAAKAGIDAVPALPSLRVGRFEQPKEAAHIFLGGNPQRKGDEVTAASMKGLDNVVAPYALPNETPEQARRLALAKWLADAKNPLTPRVLANRLWAWHFGTGIVDTPSDFGFMGGKPSHPELLDWLARELVAPGDTSWRLKRMHKLIMMSQTYRQSGAVQDAAAAVDAEDRLLWRFPPQRLTAEEIRDTMLALAGKLDMRMGGPGFRLYDYLQDNVATYKPKEHEGPETYRRAVYHQQARAMRVDVLSDFDAPDCAFAAAKRDHTTTPLQALTMMNHSFTMDMAAALAERLEREAGKDAAAEVQRAFLLAFERAPDSSETAASQALIEKYGLRAFCRGLLNFNELIYLE